MVKNFISTAFVMLSLSSVANAGALFSADKSQDYGVFENNLVPLEQSHDNSMAIKNLDGNKEYGVLRNNLVPLEQSHDNDMAYYITRDHQELFWKTANIFDLQKQKQQQKESKKS